MIGCATKISLRAHFTLLPRSFTFAQTACTNVKFCDRILAAIRD